MDEILSKIKEQASKVKDGAVKLSQTVMDKTNTVVDQTKIKFAISKTEDKIKEIYAEIGSDIYESYAGGATEYPDVQAKCEKLDDLHKEAENLRDQLAEVSASVKCPSCGAYNNDGSAYCSACGEKIESQVSTAGVKEVVEEVVEEVVNITPEGAEEE